MEVEITDVQNELISLKEKRTTIEDEAKELLEKLQSVTVCSL